MFRKMFFLIIVLPLVWVPSGICGGKPFVKVISTDPASPAVLEAGQPVFVKIRYDSGGEKNIQTWIRPGGDDKGVQRHTCGGLKETAGEYEGWFYFDDRAAHVKSLKLRLVTNKQGDKSPVMKRITIFEDTVPVDFKWKAPKNSGPYGYKAKGASVKLGTVRPEIPAVLKVGEKFLARFQYNSGGAKSINVRIWPGKQKNGNAPPQDESQVNKRKGHSSQDQIYFAYDRPGSVSEMKFRMTDSETGRFLIQYSFPVDVTWVEGDSIKDSNGAKPVKVKPSAKASSLTAAVGELKDKLSIVESEIKTFEQLYESLKASSAKTIKELEKKNKSYAEQIKKQLSEQEFYFEIVKKFPEHQKFCESISGLANEYLKAKKFDGAKKLYQYLYQNSSDGEMAVKGLAGVVYCQESLGNESEAKQAFETLLAKYGSAEKQADSIYKIAEWYRQLGDYKRSIEVYRKSLETNTNQRQRLYANAGIGISSVRLGDTEQVNKSADIIRKDFADHKGCSRAIFIIGQEYFNIGEKKRAEKQRADSLIYHKKAVDFWKQRILDTMKGSDHEQWALMFSGISHMRLKEYQKGEEYFRKVIQDFPNYRNVVSALSWYGHCLNVMPKRDSASVEEAVRLAEEVFKGFVEKNPKHVCVNTALRELGNFYARQSLNDAAVEVYKRLLDNDINQLKYIHSNYCKALKAGGRDEKIQEINKVLAEIREKGKIPQPKKPAENTGSISSSDKAKPDDNKAKSDTVTIQIRGKITSTKVPGYINVGDIFQVVAVIDNTKTDKTDYYKESQKYHKGYIDGLLAWELKLLEGSTGSYKGAKMTEASKDHKTVITFDFDKVSGHKDQLSIIAGPANVVSEKLGDSVFYNCGLNIRDKKGLSLNDTGAGQTLAELTNNYRILKNWATDSSRDFDFHTRVNGKNVHAANGIIESIIVVDGNTKEAKEPVVVGSERKLFDSIFSLARDHYSKRKYSEAKKLFQYLSASSPYKEHVFKAHRWLFACELWQGNDISAAAAFEALWEKRCGEEAFIDAVMGVCHPYIYGGSKKNSQKAVEIIDRLLKELPGHKLTIRILKNKAEAYLGGKHGDKADAVIDEIIRKYPKHDELGATLNEIAFNCLERKDRDRCERLYNMMFKIKGDETSHVLAHSGIAMCAVWKNDEATVEAKIKLLLNKYKKNEKLSFSIFVIAMEYRRISRTEPHNSPGRKEYLQKAIDALNYCIYELDNDGQLGYACYHASFIYRSFGNYRKVIELCELQLEKSPGFKYAWNSQHQITLALDRLYSNKEMTLEEVKPLILESCEKFRKNYPDCHISGAWKKYFDKYSNL